jgi:hypothetical protein
MGFPDGKATPSTAATATTGTPTPRASVSTTASDPVQVLQPDLGNGPRSTAQSNTPITNQTQPNSTNLLPTEITICGAGNVSQFLICSITQDPLVKLNVYAPYKNYGERLRSVWTGMADGEAMTCTGALGEMEANLSTVVVTSDPFKAFGATCGLVIMSTVVQAMPAYLRDICRYAAKGTVILGMIKCQSSLLSS